MPFKCPICSKYFDTDKDFTRHGQENHDGILIRFKNRVQALRDTPKQCTWKDCTEDAEYPQVDKKGNIWSDLCGFCNEQLNSAIHGVNPGYARNLMRAWVLAKGGAKRASKDLV